METSKILRNVILAYTFQKLKKKYISINLL